MSFEKRMSKVIGITSLTAIGFLLMPPLIKKYSNRLYKVSLKKDEIDFDNMGPEIVNKKNYKEESSNGY